MVGHHLALSRSDKMKRKKMHVSCLMKHPSSQALYIMLPDFRPFFQNFIAKYFSFSNLHIKCQ